MLRNLVTSLLQHEQIKTTLPKARETARLAEKIIGLGKNGQSRSLQKASGFLLDQTVVPKIFNQFAKRYALRQGGYTRIHKFGNRPGDNAPMAILELVDNPRDIKFEMTARAVGCELLKARLGNGTASEILQKGVDGVREFIENELYLDSSKAGQLRPATRSNLLKTLKYRSQSMLDVITRKVEDHVNLLLAKPVMMMALLDNPEKDKGTPFEFAKKYVASHRYQWKAGQAPPGETMSALRLSKGAIVRPGRRPHEPKYSRFTLENIYEKRL